VNLDLSTILLGGFIGLMGLALVSYGRKEVRIPHIAVGLILLVYPYFVGNLIAIVVIAVALVAGLTLASRLGY
jgi:hypothetical protein